MAKLYNLARMTTATTSTGTITLGSAVSGFLTFANAGVSDGDIVSYGISDGSASEVGYGVYTSSGTTLTRNVTTSTNSNAAINLSGTAQVFITPSASDLLPFSQTNFVINGGMQVSQIGTSFGSTSGTDADQALFLTDCFKTTHRTEAVCTFTQDTDAPTGYTNCIKMTVGTADGTIGSLQYVNIFQVIEGTRSWPLAFGTASAQYVTVGFWVKAHRTGTYSFSLSNNARSYVVNYTVSVADTWEFKTMVIPGDTSGSWATTTSAGIIMYWGIAVGSTYQGTANAWNASLAIGTSSTVNGVAATSDVFKLTGVFMVPGIWNITSADAPKFMRSFQENLTLAQRYYEHSYDQGTAPGTNTVVGVSTAEWNTTFGGSIPGITFRVPKRAVPTVSAYTNAGVAGKWHDYLSGTDFTVTFGNPSTSGVRYTAGSSSTSLTPSDGHWIADARL